MVKKSIVYTATGDRGMTSLVGGKRVAKNDVRIEAYGTIDELNSFIGLLDNLHNIPSDMKEFLKVIQNKLFNIGAYLATDNQPASAPVAGLDADDIARIEHEIDVLDSELPPMTNFILPGGSRISSLAHVCRTIARRAERRIVELSNTALVNEQVLIYINRLSDYFFVLARFNNIHNQFEENFWDKDCR